MDYQTFEPRSELSALVKFYWTLEVPFDPANQKQKLIPDGCCEMTFNLEDGIKKYVSETDFIVHPPCMVMGQRTKSYYIEPLGNVNSFAVCFYPHGFANFANLPLKDLVDRESPIADIFGESAAAALETDIFKAQSTEERIAIVEEFLLRLLSTNATHENIVKSTVDAILETNGGKSIHQILEDNPSKRRQLERKFKKQIGLSPKQLSRVLRLQSALKILLNKNETLTNIAYESDYFDQAHFIKDFKEFTGITPRKFLGNAHMELSSLFYK